MPELPARRPLMLEQLTLDCPDTHIARQFYVNALGGKECLQEEIEGTDLRVNVGSSQLCLQVQSSFAADAFPVEDAAVWPGHIELWTQEELSEVHERLERERETLAPALAAFCPGLPPQPPATLVGPAAEAAPARLLAVCPYGNKYVITHPPALTATGKPFRVIGCQPGGHAGLVSLPRLVHAVPIGAARRVHGFFAEVLGVAATLEVGSESEERGSEESRSEGGDGGEAAAGGGESSEGGEGGPMACMITFASGQVLVFDERAGAEASEDLGTSSGTSSGEQSAPPSGFALTLYLSSPEAFRTAFRGANNAGLVCTNPRYEGAKPHSANALTWSEAAACHQFRVWSLTDASGGGGLHLHLTIRSPSHELFPFPDVKGAILEGPGYDKTLTPLPQPTHPAQPGFVRVPYGRGYFGAPAQEIARKKHEQQQHLSMQDARGGTKIRTNDLHLSSLPHDEDE